MYVVTAAELVLATDQLTDKLLSLRGHVDEYALASEIRRLSDLIDRCQDATASDAYCNAFRALMWARNPNGYAPPSSMFVTETAEVHQNAEWFSKMTPDEQDQYLKHHPKSRQTKDAHARPGSRPKPMHEVPPGTSTIERQPGPNPNAPSTDGQGATSHLVASPDRSTWPAHVQRLKLPPAWTDVRISHDPDADLQAIGKDAKGRAQYVYSEKYAQSQAAAKFDRIKQLHAGFDRVYSQNRRDMKSEDPQRRETAECMSLVMRMGLRPGGEVDTGADTKAYGATTLIGSHVVTGPDGRTRLQFVGKKGISLDLPVPDAATARMLHERAKQAGPDKPLFPKTSASQLLDYAHSLGSGQHKTKDFRTLRGTLVAHKRVAELPLPTNDKEYKKAVRDVATHVSRALGNTPAVALASYICPSAFAPWHASKPSDHEETASSNNAPPRPPRSKLPLVYYGRVGTSRPIPKVHDIDVDDDNMPHQLPRSTISLLGVDPRRLFAN